MSQDFTLKLWRFSSEEFSTLGLLMAGNPEPGEHFRCFTLEDEHREVKVKDKTRIPAGRYEIIKRHGSPAFGHLDKKFDWHDGMLWLQDVPGFTWIYMHAGIRHENTSGCILIADRVYSNVDGTAGGLSRSWEAYERLYKEVSTMLDAGKRVFIEIEDYS